MKTGKIGVDGKSGGKNDEGKNDEGKRKFQNKNHFQR